MIKPANFLPTNTSLGNSSIEFNSLLHLRWGAIIGQILLILLVGFYLHTHIPYPIVSAIIVFETSSNLLFTNLQKRKQILPAWLFAAIMFVDVALLTILLSQTGGTMNPFTFLYLLHIVIGAILMPPVYAWSLSFFTILCYSSFFMFPAAMQAIHDLASQEPSIPQILCVETMKFTEDASNSMDLHLKGMLVAFSITSLFIVYFISRIRKALANQNLMLSQLEEQQLQNEKLRSLATLAAGAAHEFANPLSTIKVASGEMLYSIKNGIYDQELLDDLLLIRGQIKRCEEILYQMSEDAGDHRGANFEQFSIKELVDDILFLLPEDQQSLVNVTIQNQSIILNGPKQTLSRTIKGIVHNAIDASNDQHPQNDSKISEKSNVNLDIWQDNEFIYFKVQDNGIGIDKQTLKRVTEPFFTTKETGKGLGLGLFLAQSVAERFGGTLSLTSDNQQGTVVVFSLAREQLNMEDYDA